MIQTDTLTSKFTLAAAMLLAAAGGVSAQNISKFVISDEAAKKTLIKNEISVETAEKITQACVEFAKKNNQAVSVFILSPTGQIVHSYRMDGQVPINIEDGQMIGTIGVGGGSKDEECAYTALTAVVGPQPPLAPPTPPAK
jgi:phenylpyruvate tautomerase PptA (4-oxalocrotonate tautomerase family)